MFVLRRTEGEHRLVLQILGCFGKRDPLSIERDSFRQNRGSQLYRVSGERMSSACSRQVEATRFQTQ